MRHDPDVRRRLDVLIQLYERFIDPLAQRFENEAPRCVPQGPVQQDWAKSARGRVPEEALEILQTDSSVNGRG